MKSTLNFIASGLKHIFTPPPAPVLDDAREKAQFTEVQRRLRIYLRALWNCEFIIKQGGIDSLGYEVEGPYIEYFVINLPPVYYDSAPEDAVQAGALELYRAAAAHAAAHLVYTDKRFSARSLDKLQISLISLVEDARIETLAIRRFPGLQRLWARMHTATPQDNTRAGHYFDRLARALLDESYEDDDPWVELGRTLFRSAEDLENDRVSRDIGIRLALEFQKKRLKFNRQLDRQSAPYRDDNRFLWMRRGEPMEVVNPYFRSESRIGLEEGDKDPKNKPIPVPGGEADSTAMGTFFYPEWNYRTGSEDQAWVTLREREPFHGSLRYVSEIVAENQHLIARMKALLRALRDGAASRLRKLEDGDEIDINAAVRAQLDIRQGLQPDNRIMMRSVRKTRDISVLLLLDLSRSMNNKLPDRDQTALELTQQASVLFAEALSSVGDPFAIHGFYSDTRHFVEYIRMKDFDQAYDNDPKAAIAGMMGKRGTRMGAAVRHATHLLNNRKSGKKLLLIITDGEPSDVDAPDRKYLHDDTKKSVEDAKRNGIHTYCVTLDPGADEYVSRIFGAKNYIVVDHIKHLPEKVLLIYAGLSR